MTIPYRDKPIEADLDIADQVRQANITYHDAIASEYESDPSTALVFTREAQTRIERIVGLLGQTTEGGLFVDVGCGTGNVLKFAQRAFDRAIGMDISAGMLSVAKERGLVVCLADALTLPVASASVDAISCFSVLYHLYHQRPYLAEFYRVLKPGGYLYTDFDPNGACLLRQSFFLRIVQFIYRHILSLRFGLWRREGIQSEESRMAGLQKLAECHQNYTSGLDPAAFRYDLTALEFREVGIYYHYSTLSLSQVKRLPTLVKFQKLMFPFLATIAKK